MRAFHRNRQAGKRRYRPSSGQAIVEYAAILAFVAAMCALVFALTQGTLAQGISSAFSAITGQINSLVTAAS